jgi:hypothetical protein
MLLETSKAMTIWEDSSTVRAGLSPYLGRAIARIMKKRAIVSKMYFVVYAFEFMDISVLAFVGEIKEFIAAFLFFNAM